MSRSNHPPKIFGFSTGALERGDYTTALTWMKQSGIQAVELSALRHDELEPLVNHLEMLPLSEFKYISFHAPSYFAKNLEWEVVELLSQVHSYDWNIIVHPDVIYTPNIWRQFGARLLIENMDRRKGVGRTADELETCFQHLPEARLCLDLAHARQMDTTLSLLSEIVSRFSCRIGEIHISELDSSCRHQPLSVSAIRDYRRFASRLGHAPNVIIESQLEASLVEFRVAELELAKKVFEPSEDLRQTTPRNSKATLVENCLPNTSRTSAYSKTQSRKSIV